MRILFANTHTDVLRFEHGQDDIVLRATSMSRGVCRPCAALLPDVCSTPASLVRVFQPQNCCIDLEHSLFPRRGSVHQCIELKCKTAPVDGVVRVCCRTWTPELPNLALQWIHSDHAAIPSTVHLQRLLCLQYS